MIDNLPPSLDRFEAQLERAIGDELGARRHQGLARLLRARRRLLAGTTIGAAGTGAVLAIVLSAAGSSPAFAVARHRDGSYSVTLRALSAIPAANRKLSQMRVHAVLVRAGADCQTPPTVQIPPREAVIPAPRARLEIAPPQAPVRVCGSPPLRPLRQAG